MAERELVDRSGGPDACWLWQGTLNEHGYGYRGKRLAHRIAYQEATGLDPKGLAVRHICDNPPCVNPAHLRLGTQADNLRDMWAKGRGFRPQGELHPRARLTPTDVVAIRGADLSRYGSGVALARRYGITARQMYSIRSGQRWSHLIGGT